MEKYYYIYILASQKNGTLYIGVTGNLLKRAYEHRMKLADGFTADYNVHKLVYYEIYDDINEALNREKQLKWWKRDWKIKLIELKNPNWKDLFDEIASGW